MTVDITAEAQRFWRETSFYHICCNNDDCELEAELLDDKVYVDMLDHGYTVTLYRKESLPGRRPLPPLGNLAQSSP